MLRCESARHGTVPEFMFLLGTQPVYQAARWEFYVVIGENLIL
jgi:hypothetical protein